MSKVKEKVMEEVKKEKGRVEKKKEGKWEKKKVEKLSHPGSSGNPFKCGQGLKCPWVNGEKGPRCGLWHPEPPTVSRSDAAKDKISAMMAGGDEKEDRMAKEVKMEKTEYVEEKAMGMQEVKKLDNLTANESLLKSAPKIKRGADSTTRKSFTDLLQEIRPARSTHMPKEFVVGKKKRKLQPPPKRKECQHMLSVKSLSKGWGFGWQGTRDGKIYHLPENSDTGFYKLTDPHRPTSENCPCMRLTPVQFAPEPKTKDIRRQNADTKQGQKFIKPSPKRASLESG